MSMVNKIKSANALSTISLNTDERKEENSKKGIKKTQKKRITIIQHWRKIKQFQTHLLSPITTFASLSIPVIIEAKHILPTTKESSVEVQIFQKWRRGVKFVKISQHRTNLERKTHLNNKKLLHHLRTCSETCWWCNGVYKARLKLTAPRQRRPEKRWPEECWIKSSTLRWRHFCLRALPSFSEETMNDSIRVSSE